MRKVIVIEDLTFDIYPGAGYPDGESVLSARGEKGIVFVLRSLYEQFTLMGEREFAVTLFSRSRKSQVGTGRYVLDVTNQPLVGPLRVLSVVHEDRAIEGIIMELWQYVGEEIQREDRERLGPASGIYCTYDGCGMMIYGPVYAAPRHDGPMCSSCHTSVMLETQAP